MYILETKKWDHEYWKCMKHGAPHIIIAVLITRTDIDGAAAAAQPFARADAAGPAQLQAQENQHVIVAEAAAALERHVAAASALLQQAQQHHAPEAAAAPGNRVEAVAGAPLIQAQNRPHPYHHHFRGPRAGRRVRARKRFQNFLVMMNTMADEFFGYHHARRPNRGGNNGRNGNAVAQHEAANNNN
ncbi:hypothetical protein QAD02_010410 [Eretmocerus hayati]|uniref:Uncharacterized protein n=1 Tax=Eretmocerus hayati TaxID=131215 RepID=A0ACC2NU47_9HYME|nr:hypothetical protein QAD02_010410 [Eretmocerus hayati]